eukprot:2939067-Amphidinium_carterae.1
MSKMRLWQSWVSLSLLHMSTILVGVTPKTEQRHAQDDNFNDMQKLLSHLLERQPSVSTQEIDHSLPPTSKSAQRSNAYWPRRSTHQHNFGVLWWPRPSMRTVGGL